MAVRSKLAVRTKRCGWRENVSLFRWASFGIVAGVFLIVYFHRVSTSVLVTDIARTFNISGTMVGLLASMYFYSYALMQPVVGILVDRWLPRRIVTLSAVLMGFGSLLFAVAPGYSWALLGRIVIGFGAGGVFVPFMCFASRWFAVRERGFVYSIWNVVGNSGAVIAAGPLGVLSSTIGWRSALLVLTVITTVLAALVWHIVRDEPGEVTPGHKQTSLPSRQSPSGQHSSSWFTILRQTISIKSVRWALLTGFLGYGALMAFQGLWGVRFFRDVYELDQSAASNMITLLPMGFVVGGIVLSKVFDTRFRRAVYVSGYCMSTGVYLLFALCPTSLSLSLLGIAVFSLGFTNAVGPYVLRLYSQVLPVNNFGTAMGIVNTVPFLGGVVFQPLTGTLFDLFGAVDKPFPIIAYRLFFTVLTMALLVATISAFRTAEKSTVSAP